MRSNGGIIGAKKAVSTGAASGIWSLAQAQREQGASNWPGLVVLSAFTYTGTYETHDFGSYRYVVLTSSGTFTASNNIVVEATSAGGGGSPGYGCAYGGGGGGGELDIWTSCSLTAPVTVTIGARGSAAPYGGGSGQGGTTTFGSFTSSLGGGYGNQAHHGTTGGSGGGGGGGGGYNQNAGSASGSNTNAGGGGGGFGTNNYYAAGGGGGATSVGAVGTSSGNGGGAGGEGYSLATLDSNLTSANFPTALAGMTVICSGGGGALQLNGGHPPVGGGRGGTGGGNGARTYSGAYLIAGNEVTVATSYGSGGGHGWQSSTALHGVGMGGVVIVRYSS